MAQEYFKVALVVWAVILLEASLTVAWPGFFRRFLPESGHPDWTQEAQRNLSRFESQLLLRTLDKHHESYALGKVPYDLFNPIVTCPPPSRLMRLDPTGPTEHPTRWVDGAKWMCVPFPRTARPGCVVFSFGSNEQYEFEQAALDMTPCSIHTFDCTTGMLGNVTQTHTIHPTRHIFHPFCVGSRDMVRENPSQMLNWEGLVKVVRPLGPVVTRQESSGFGRRRTLQHAEGLGGAGVGGRLGVGAPHGAATGDSADVGGDEEQVVVEDGWGRRLMRGGGIWGGAGAGSTSRARSRSRRRNSGPEVFIAKIDVEGFEWQLLAEWGPDTPGLPAFLAIEIHNWMDTYTTPPPSAPPLATKPSSLSWFWSLFGRREDPDKVAIAAQRAAAKAAFDRRQRVYGGELGLMFLHLARLGYAVVSREDNPNGDFEAKLCCAEFLFIRVRGPEEGRPGMWDWTHWFSSITDGLAPLIRGAGRRRRAGR